MRRIVLLFDGTWNDDQDPGKKTNIVELRSLIENDGTNQIVEYVPGVGTSGGWLSRLVDGGTGLRLSEKVRAGYKFLAEQYEPGATEIYLFGFSRGAFTARSLAGFIGASGLLKKEYSDEDRVLGAWAHYRLMPHLRNQGFTDLLADQCHSNVRIQFLGVFDTVGSLGIPEGEASDGFGSLERFHDTGLGANANNAFHALAIDERRRPFLPTLWTKPEHSAKQNVEQVWFPGVHSDIGGGYERAAERSAGRTPIADHSLAWMLTRVKKYTDLQFTPLPVQQSTIGDPHDSLSEKYFRSRERPLIRLINGIALNPEPTFSHAPFTPKAEPGTYPYQEFVHQSALDRMKQPGGAKYDPVNLRSALAAIGAGQLQVVGSDGSVLDSSATQRALARLT